MVVGDQWKCHRSVHAGDGQSSSDNSRSPNSLESAFMENDAFFFLSPHAPNVSVIRILSSLISHRASNACTVLYASSLQMLQKAPQTPTTNSNGLAYPSRRAEA